MNFHARQGVEKFYLYDNSSTDDWKPEISRNSEVIPWPHEKPCQLSAYQDCIDRLKGEKMWVAFIDIDEFLFSPQYRYNGILQACEYLEEYFPDQKAFGINWLCYGSGGQEVSGSEPVTERFLFRTSKSNPCNLHIKSIIRMDQEVKTGGDPHFFKVESGTRDIYGNLLDSPFTAEYRDDAILRLHHYCSKSKEEWTKRKALGTPDRAKIETPEWVWGLDRAGIFDDSILRLK
jgi:hypothetical protein